MSLERAMVVSAKRSALGRIGGLHRRRRVEELAAPVVAAVLAEAGVAAGAVDQVLLGNTSYGQNAARIVALASGLPESVPAMTVDRRCASGLDAIALAAALVSSGRARIVVAGGAESFSTAPWRLVKPRTVYQLPYFERYGAAPGEGTHSAEQFADGDELARALDLDRGKLDAYALRSHLKAYLAHKAKRFAGEIVPLRAEPSEAADESPDGDLAADELADLPAFDEQNGFLSPGNVSHLHDGAAVALVVAESVWRDLGTKPALAISASASRGIVSGRGSIAASAAVAALPPCVRSSAALYETSEASAAEALGLCHDLELGDELLNVEGGAIARGHPGGASGAVIVTRLYALLLRHYRSEFPKRAIAVQSALGGQATAVAFEVA